MSAPCGCVGRLMQVLVMVGGLAGMHDTCTVQAGVTNYAGTGSVQAVLAIHMAGPQREGRGGLLTGGVQDRPPAFLGCHVRLLRFAP